MSWLNNQWYQVHLPLVCHGDQHIRIPDALRQQREAAISHSQVIGCWIKYFRI